MPLHPALAPAPALALAQALAPAQAPAQAPAPVPSLPMGRGKMNRQRTRVTRRLRVNYLYSEI